MSMEELCRLTIRLQKKDEDAGDLIGKTYRGKIVWTQAVQSGLQGSVYSTSDDEENKYLLQCYKEEGNTLYRLYKNKELVLDSEIARYLERIIMNNNPEKLQNVDLSAYCPSELLQSVKMKEVKKYVVTPVKRKVKIGVKDMVIRRNIFKCMHNKHSIEDIDTVIKVMNKNIGDADAIITNFVSPAPLKAKAVA